MNRIGISLAALLPTLALVGCNDGSLRDKGPSTLTQANSQQVGQALGATISGAASGNGTNGAGAKKLTQSLHHSSSFTGDTGECWTVGGDETDADADGIPLDALYTLADCTYAQDGWTETYSGTEGISDPSPDAADFAYAETFDLNAGFTGPDVTETDHLVGSDGGHMTGENYTYTDNFSDDYSGTYQGQSYAGSYAENLTYVYTPLNTMTVDGTWSEIWDGQTVDTSVATTDPLQLNACACVSGIQSGTVVATSGDSSVTMTWLDCEETVTYSGPQS